jgi:hypothetical protein
MPPDKTVVIMRAYEATAKSLVIATTNRRLAIVCLYSGSAIFGRHAGRRPSATVGVVYVRYYYGTLPAYCVVRHSLAPCAQTICIRSSRDRQ